MDFLYVDENYADPERFNIEMVERKGLGHPDTLADALAERISTAYSTFCLNQYGAILHHNIDKLYIGGGFCKRDFGYREFVKPVKVLVNGRMSASIGGKQIDIEAIQNKVIIEYLSRILPHLNVKREVMITNNSTQFSNRPFWFSPRDKNDLPELSTLYASDTSVYVAYWPLTICEELAIRLEQFFWAGEKEKRPRFSDVGQDIKCMVFRKGNHIDITLCVPLISTVILSREQYDCRIQELEQDILGLAKSIIGDKQYSVRVGINRLENGYRVYLLGTGSCIECGEEGTVGRGNFLTGVISVFRPHSMEAPCGKNPMYHTGRVLSYLTSKLAKAIFSEFGVKCSIMAMCKNSQSLLPPAVLFISLEHAIDRGILSRLIADHFFELDYVKEILSSNSVV